MGKVIAGFSISLDGFIADPNDDIQQLFGWYFNGDTGVPVPDSEMMFKTSAASAEVLRDRFDGVGAIVTGRRDFDVSKAWGGKTLLGAATFIVTHRIPPEWSHEGSPFTFVTDGVGSAIARAMQAAGDKKIVVGSSTTIQQCLQAGLLDEIHLDLVPILLGGGVRLFDNLSTTPINLETISVVAAPGVTHLQFRVVR